MNLIETEPQGYYELLAMEDDHPRGEVGHVCSICNRPLDGEPCPEHAPSDVPGLTKVVCVAERPHHYWSIAGDYYDGPCYQCLYEATILPRPQCRHWPWRRWRATRPAVAWLKRLRLINGYALDSGNGCDWCVTSLGWCSPFRRRL